MLATKEGQINPWSLPDKIDAASRQKLRSAVVGLSVGARVTHL